MTKVEVATMLSMPGLVYQDPNTYRPGVCNIGPAEITRRRRSGHAGLIVSIVLFGALVVVGAPHWTRLVLVLTAGVSASGYLQAWFHFCAGFGSRGVYNFGPTGTVEQVADVDARARDRRRSLEIGLGSLAIGLIVAVAAAVLPV
jgi:hypothetical protein